MTLKHNDLIPDVSDIVVLLHYRSSHTPGKTAYNFLADGETVSVSLTYQELDRRAQAVAGQLLSRRQPGDRVLLAYPPGVDFVVGLFGCLYAGIVAVPSPPPGRNQAMERWQRIVASSQAKMVLSTSEFVAMYSTPGADNSQTNEEEISWIATENILPVLTEESGFPDLSGETLAFLQYTSGSIGNPKGVMVTHQNLMRNAAIMQEAFKLSSDSKAMVWLPTYHDMGLMGGIIQPLCIGISMTLMPPLLFLQKPLRWLQAISRYRVGTSGAPNFAYNLCVEKIKPEQRAELDLSCWEIASVGAEPVCADTIKNFTRAFEPSGFSPAAFYPCYGLAEATLFVAGGGKNSPPIFLRVDTDALERHQVVLGEEENKTRTLVGNGQGKLGQKIIIVDPASRVECRAHQVGEIWLSGTNISQGYWKRPQETLATFQAYLAGGEGPFFCTGDLGFIQDGELFITGRLKEVIIIRGRNHYPQDIERTVHQCHPALEVGGGASFSVDVDGTEQLVVVQEVQRKHLRKLDVKSIVQQIRLAVNEQHGLQVSEVALARPGSVPRTSSGKVRRHACRETFLSGSLNVLAI